MKDEKILLVEDDEKITKLVQDYLNREGYNLSIARDGRQGLEMFEREEADVVLLDLMLPGLDGMDVARKIRKKSEVPLIMLTARSEEADRVAGLELGADDYITKPFSLRELSARIKAVLRRSTGEIKEDEVLVRGPLEINFNSHQVHLNDQRVELTPTEFELLSTLAQSPGRVYGRKQLLDAIGRYPSDSMRRIIDTHIKNLRKKIETEPEDPEFVETVHGVGYRFRDKRS